MSHPIFSVIDNEVRVRMMCCLSQGEKTVTELIENCGLSQSAVSQHLHKMRKAGVVEVTKKGREVYYRISDPRVESLCKQILAYVGP
jgi:DNA-binding transcriptional ArsR family regulator